MKTKEVITYFDEAIDKIFKKYKGNKRGLMVIKKEAESYIKSLHDRDEEEHAKNVKVFGKEEAERIRDQKENSLSDEEERNGMNEVYIPF